MLHKVWGWSASELAFPQGHMYLYSRDSKLAYWQLLSVFRESSPLAWDPLAFELGCEVLALKVRESRGFACKVILVTDIRLFSSAGFWANREAKQVR